MNASHWPLFGFGCLVFVGLCTILAVAVWLVFRSGEKGSTKLGAPAGCLVGCSLLAVAGVAGLGVVFVLALHAKQELVRHGPFRKFELELEPPRAALAPVAPGETRTQRARLVIELSSLEGWAEFSEDLSRWLRTHLSADIGVRLETRETDSGARSVLTFEVDVPERELEELRRDLRQILPTLRLPAHVSAELRD